jgi:hypothetical protein
MTGHGAKFGRKQEEAIAALITHRTVDEAARAINVAPKTLLRWLEIPAFRKKYLKARREAVFQAIALIQHATGAASVTILKIMADTNMPAAVRLRAAECVFDRAIKGIELEDIDARVTELERAQEENKSGGRK